MDTIVATSLAVTFSVGSFDVSWQLQNVVVFVIYSGEIQMHFRIIWEIESKYNMCYSFLNSWAAFCIVTISNFYICYSTIPRMRSNNFSAVASVFSSKNIVQNTSFLSNMLQDYLLHSKYRSAISATAKSSAWSSSEKFLYEKCL